MQCVEEDMRLVTLCGDDAQDRVDCRIGIRGTASNPCKHEKTDVKTMMMNQNLLVYVNFSNKYYEVVIQAPIIIFWVVWPSQNTLYTAYT